MKRFLKNIFWNSEKSSYVYANNFLAAVTLISILAIVLESVQSLTAYINMFRIIEYAAVFVFSLEYVGRIFSAKNSFKYMFSFFGLVDLISIIPTFFSLGNLTYLKSVRAARILQFLRSLRLLKIERKRRSAGVQVLTAEIYFFALFFLILTFGILLYVVEPNMVQNIPAGMLWAAQFILGGIAQPQASNLWGDIVIILGRFSGLILFGFLIAVVGQFVQKVLFGVTLKEGES